MILKKAAGRRAPPAWQLGTIRGYVVRRIRPRAAVCTVATAVLLLAGSVLPARADSGYVLEQLVWDEPPATGIGLPGLTAFDGDHLAAADNGSGQSDSSVSYYGRQGQVWHLEQRITGLRPVTSSAVQGGLLVVGSAASDGSDPKLSFYEGRPLGLVATLAVPAAPTFVDLDGDQLIVHFAHTAGVGSQIYERHGRTWSLAPGGVLGADEPPPGPDSTPDLDGKLAVVPKTGHVLVYRRQPDGWHPDGVIDVAGSNKGRSPQARIAGKDLLVSSSSSDCVCDLDDSVMVLRATGTDWRTEQRLPVADRVVDLDAQAGSLVVLTARGSVVSWDEKGSTWAPSPSKTYRLPDRASFSANQRDVGALHLAGDRLAVRSSDHSAGPGALRDAGRVIGVIVREGGKAAVAAPAPSDVSVTPLSSSGKATLHWRAPGGTPVLKYVVQTEAGTRSYERADKTYFVDSDQGSLRVDGLKADTDYRFWVRAVGPAGLGSPGVSNILWAGRPRQVTSPFEESDPRGDHADPRQDLRRLVVDATGRAVTVRLRVQQPTDPYTDPMYRGAHAVQFRVEFRTPTLYRAVLNNKAAQSQGSDARIEGEDFTSWFVRPRPCVPGAFPARYVDGYMQVTVPSSCIKQAGDFRTRAWTSPGPGGDATAWSPPVSRLKSTGKVSVVNVKASSVTVDATGQKTFTISYEAKHSSGIERAVIRVFSVATGQQPVRLGKQTCQRLASTRSLCTATFTIRAGEVRDQDAGRWRVFTEVHARNKTVRVSEQVQTFSLRRYTRLASVVSTVKGRQLTVTGRLEGARWNTRSTVGLENRSVLLQYRKNSASRYVTVDTFRTAPNGRFLTTVTKGDKGSWRVVFEETQTYARSSTSVKG